MKKRNNPFTWLRHTYINKEYIVIEPEISAIMGLYETLYNLDLTYNYIGKIEAMDIELYLEESCDEYGRCFKSLTK